MSYPAAFPNVIGVGAVDERKVRAPYSNFGPELSVVAPGGDLDRDDDNDGDPDGILQQTFDPFSAQFGIYDDFAYFYFDGTSSATPHVSAMAALLVSQGITDPVAVRKAIESTALDLGATGPRRRVRPRAHTTRRRPDGPGAQPVTPRAAALALAASALLAAAPGLRRRATTASASRGRSATRT